jgi:hypothetical protein
MTMLPCVEDWNELAPWNVNSRSLYCLATQIYRLLMVSESSYTAFTRGRHGFLSHAILIQSTPCYGVSFNILLLFSRLFLGVSSGSVRQYFRPKCTHFCVSYVLSVPPISYSFADVALMCCEKDKEIELREHYAVCAWCLCVSVSVCHRFRFQFLNHLTDVHEILCGNYATGGRSNPIFPTPSSDNMADTWTCEVGGMIVPLGLGLWTYVVIDVRMISARFRIVNVCGYRCFKDIHIFLRYM